MDKMLLLLLTILGVMLFSWIFQGFRLYRSYKGDIYGALYGGFLPYFFRYVVIRDCSESWHLRSQIGTHRIVFSTITGEEKQKTKFCVIFYSKGVMVLCYDRASGKLRGGPSGKSWNVIRKEADGKEHIYRRPNPTRDLMAYLNRLREVFPNLHMEARFAFSDGVDHSQLTAGVKAINFRDLDTELKSVQAEFISDDEVGAMYRTLIGK